MKYLTSVVLIVLVNAVFSSATMAQPKHLQPGSVLVYPHYEVSLGAGTIICVTNTNSDTEYCNLENTLAGDVVVHFVYIDGDDWSEFDRFEYMTPGDTLCTITGQHNVQGGRGFLLVIALDPNDMATPIQFDHLIGSAIVVESGANVLWGYTPYVFEGLPGNGDPAACVRPDTDDDGDGFLDFDGTEYNNFPGMLYIDSFLEEKGTAENMLTMMSLGGADYSNSLRLLFWNNVEQKFSRSFRFTCWWRGSLSEISSIAGNLGGEESGDTGRGGGLPQTGWVSIEPGELIDIAGNPVGRLAPILGVTRSGIGMYTGGRAMTVGLDDLIATEFPGQQQ